MNLTKTDLLMSFFDVMIGNVFWYGGRFYTRTGYGTASELKASSWKDGIACNWDIPEMRNELVNAVGTDERTTQLLNDYKAKS